jgi:hypothetical protein
MKRFALAIVGLLAVSQAAGAATWSVISFSTTGLNAPQILAAADKLMSSTAGKTFPGRLYLQASVADGDNPATHAFTPIYKSAADQEAFVQKLQADPAWSEFLGTMAKLTQPVSTTLFRTVKSGGEVVDTDTVWMTHSFNVNDPATFLAAIDTFIASPTGQKFPGQVHLSAVVAGGLSPVSHVISVGYASEAEMEAWTTSLAGTADWVTYLAASQASAEYLGGSLGRTLKTWGPASLKDLTTP